MFRVAIVAGSCLISVVSFAAPRPNVVWVMADDLGWGEPGLYPSSSPHGRIATPYLDKFGKEGVVFKQAYAGYTVCAPSRTTFFTGRHSGQFVKHGLSGEAIQPSQNVTTLAQMLKSAGYNTGAFGKVAPLTFPTRQGFDAFVGQVNQGYCHNMYPKDIDTGLAQLNFPLSGNKRKKSRGLCMKNPELYNYTIDVFHDTGMAWLEAAAKKSEPFFLYLSYTIPHAGGWGDAPKAPEQGAPVPTDLQYADKPWPDVEKDHAAVITYLDRMVGDLMQRLKALGVDKDTLVFFASDNGAHLEGGHSHLFFDSTGGLPGHKRSMYEGGIRSPTMARWPAAIKPGRSSDFPWAFWDVMPTLAELAGAEAPSGIDGISIVPELQGGRQPQHEYLFFTWIGAAANSGGKSYPGYNVRMGDFKGIVPHCGAKLHPSMDDEMQVFDLAKDPFETTDLAPANASLAERLKRFVVGKDLTCMCYQCGFQATSEDLFV
mmetsp:Transcript_11031/g.22801  ORF Transcript_11031/g.22801 Transcript_11031/m.22801 type:complete len:486 (-) Transcript_11031:100-1557(-)